MPKIFISYRREDTSYETTMIFEFLAGQFGRENVFMDVDTIPAGVDFRQHLRNAVEGCDVVLVMMGQNWLDATVGEGRRLDDSRDFVRIEVESALRRDIRIVPILVQGASVPHPDSLPLSIQDLAFRNALTVRAGRDLRTDIARLVRELKSAATQPDEAAHSQQASPISSSGHSDSDEELPPSSTNTPPATAADKSGRPQVPTERSLKRRAIVVITEKSVVDLGAEGICYSANDHLRMGGGVAKALSNAAGTGLQQEANAVLERRNTIPLGNVVVTRPHLLSATGCKSILHLVTLGVDPVTNKYCFPESPAEREQQIDAAITSAVEAACHQAARLKLKSLAFPLMGTRVARVRPERAVAATVRGIRNFCQSSGSVNFAFEKVYFSYFSSSRGKQAFTHELSLPENRIWAEDLVESQDEGCSTHLSNTTRLATGESGGAITVADKEEDRTRCERVPSPEWRPAERQVTVATPDGDVEKPIVYYINTIGMEFVTVPPGEFIAVRAIVPEGEEQPVRKACRVRITKSLFMSAHLITVAAFRHFVDSTGYRTEGEGPRGARKWLGKVFRYTKDINWQKPGYEQDDMCPVVCISWNDAQAFAAWLSEKEGLDYRLPTEAEWEYACRSGTKTRYYWGNDFRLDCAWSGVNSRKRPRTVGQKLPNSFGLYDMSGNVWEWCSDWFSRNYLPSAEDPQGPTTGEQRVVRGASWWNASKNCASANRFMQPQSSTGQLGGARVVCLLPEKIS